MNSVSIYVRIKADFVHRTLGITTAMPVEVTAISFAVRSAHVYFTSFALILQRYPVTVRFRPSYDRRPWNSDSTARNVSLMKTTPMEKNPSVFGSRFVACTALSL